MRFLDPIGYMESIEDHREDTKDAEQSYAHNTMGYMTRASNSHASMYHPVKSRAA